MEYNIFEDYDIDVISRMFELLDLSEDKIAQLKKPKQELVINDAQCLIDVKKRILQAKQNNEKVFIAGDYDADGIMATTIMVDLLNQLEIENGYYIPSRFNDGYGLNTKIVKQVSDKGYSLIITVDNGIKAHQAVEMAKELGMDVIITDHHIFDEPINADIVVHPDLMQPWFHKLCGAGVALQIARCFVDDYRHVIFAMIATIGDLMPLWNENRNIVIQGLKYLNEKGLINVDVLFDKQMMHDEVDIAFQIVPKINTIGRLDDDSNSNMLVKYFLSTKENEIMLVKDQINNKNVIRKNLSQAMLDKCHQLIDDSKLILLSDESFSEGICGLAAGSLAKTYNRPTIILAKTHEGIYKGSGRGVSGFDIHAYMSKYQDSLLTFGGHKMAIGLSLHEDEVLKLQNMISNDDIKIDETYEDAIVVQPEELTLELAQNLSMLKPFGEGFKLPSLVLEDITCKSYFLIKDKYPKWQLETANKLDAISFDSNNAIKSPSMMVFDIKINEYKGKQSISLLVKKAR